MAIQPMEMGEAKVTRAIGEVTLREASETRSSWFPHTCSV